MNKKSLFVSLLSIFVVTSSFGGVVNYSKYSSNWGGSSDAIQVSAYCIDPTGFPELLTYDIVGKAGNQTRSINTETVNDKVYSCIDEIGKDFGCTTTLNSVYNVVPNTNDEHYVDMVIATNVNEHGAYFCPARVVTANTEYGEPWKNWTAVSVGSSSGKCLWLCQKGWSGDGCSTNVNSGTNVGSSTVNLTPELYSDVKLSTGRETSGDVAVFADSTFSETCVGGDDDHFKKCVRRDSKNDCIEYEDHKITTEEFDKILAVVGWLKSGNGAFVRQVVVRATGIATFGNMCGSGYMCSYPFLYPAIGTEPLLVCKIGYEPNTNGDDCVEITGGENPPAGLCNGKSVTCSDSQKFDATATESGCCVDLHKISKEELRSTKSSTSGKPCWMELSSKKYKECITGKSD